MFYFYENKMGQFLFDDESFDTKNIHIPKGAKITNLSAMDINNDEIIDLIITFKHDGKIFETDIYLGQKVEDNSIKTIFNKSYTLLQAEFILADINGDRL